ncbi:MAG: YraN family protein [Bradymonadaceae bacterium]
MSSTRNNRDDTGARGERLAAEYLREDGWTIRDRNVEEEIGELDIVAQRTGHLGEMPIEIVAFVEVKSRATSIDIPTELNVTRRKRRKLVKLGKLYLSRHDLHEVSARFDIVTVDLEASPSDVSHYPAAFDALGRFN